MPSDRIMRERQTDIPVTYWRPVGELGGFMVSVVMPQADSPPLVRTSLSLKEAAALERKPGTVDRHPIIALGQLAAATSDKTRIV